MKKIIISDGQPLFCEGIIKVIENINGFKILNSVSSKIDLFDCLNSSEADILIIDFETTNGFEITDFSLLKIAHPKLKILVINANKNKDIVYKVLKTGVVNYVLKDCDINDFEEALNATKSKEKYFSKYIIDVLLNKKIRNKDNNKVNLTNKEIEIIKLIAQGLTTKDIANKIFISYHTVTTHRKNILNKLELKNTSELVMYAVSNGIIETIEYYI